MTFCHYYSAEGHRNHQNLPNWDRMQNQYASLALEGLNDHDSLIPQRWYCTVRTHWSLCLDTPACLHCISRARKVWRETAIRLHCCLSNFPWLPDAFSQVSSFHSKDVITHTVRASDEGRKKRTLMLSSCQRREGRWKKNHIDSSYIRSLQKRG